MKISIIGPGAIGSLLACRLHLLGHTVHLWSRTEAPTLSLTLRDLDDSTHHHRFAANSINQLMSSEVCIVCVKAFQLPHAMAAVSKYLSPQCPIIFSHNGMMNDADYQAITLGQPLLFATTSHGAFKPDSSQVNHTGQGTTILGALTESAQSHQSLATLLNDALGPCQWHPNIALPRWQKLAINCAINPLTALHNCNNGELGQPQHKALLTKICHEVAAVMTASGYPAQSDDLLHRAQQVIMATAANYSSMYQDIHHQRPTEIDYISGYLVKQADSLGINAEENRALWLAIQQREQNYESN